jgi:uncharacterized RDD family membrane protein YckC
MGEIIIPTFLNVDLRIELSSIGKRAGAFFIDWAIKIGYIIVANLIFKLGIFGNFNATLYNFVIFSPFIFYSFLMEWINKGQSIGKLLLGIKVIGIDGNQPSISQCAIRWLFLMVDCYLFFIFAQISVVFAILASFGPAIGFILIATTQYQQRLGDIAANTIIVNAKEIEYSIFDTIYGYNTNRKSEYLPMFPQIIKFSDKDMTTVKNLLEKSELQFNDKLAHKAANHIKKILNIETQMNDYQFLKQLLQDYNYLTLQKNEA